MIWQRGILESDMRTDEKERLKYSLGGLLYTPAINKGIHDKIRDGAFESLTSLAFCLEDTIRDECLEEAQDCLKGVLGELSRLEPGLLPLIFVRVRTPRHLKAVAELYRQYDGIITGYILPKFDLSNMEDYLEAASDIIKEDGERVYIMPILESRMVADVRHRVENLEKIKSFLDTVRDQVLNVRVGGNDFCNLFGLRRRANQTIYDIGVIRDIFVDIINIFAPDYVVSAPVWEYFGPERDGVWDEGLRREAELDRLNGFIGKTAIHPSQLPIIHECLKVSAADYDDAMGILGWNKGPVMVAKGGESGRMNEIKVHSVWARRIAMLAQIYGIRDR
jgi:citrate lyase beta subunit